MLVQPSINADQTKKSCKQFTTTMINSWWGFELYTCNLNDEVIHFYFKLTVIAWNLWYLYGQHNSRVKVILLNGRNIHSI